MVRTEKVKTVTMEWLVEFNVLIDHRLKETTPLPHEVNKN